MNKVEYGDCPMQNICERTIAGGPACGESIEHLPTLFEAEDICLNALVGQLRIAEEEAGHDDADAFDYFALGSAHLELALSPDLENVAADVHFEDAHEYLSRGIAKTDDPLSKRMESHLSSLFLPFFVKRRFGGAVTESDFDDLQDGLVDMMDGILTAPVHPRDSHKEGGHDFCVASGRERGMLAKQVGVHMLAAFDGMVLYPASARERWNDSGVPKQGHHAYPIKNQTKVPIHISSSRQNKENYDPKILNLPYDTMVETAVQYASDQGSQAPSIAKAQRKHFEWLAEKSRGDYLFEGQFLVVSSLASQLQQRISKHISETR